MRVINLKAHLCLVKMHAGFKILNFTTKPTKMVHKLNKSPQIIDLNDNFIQVLIEWA